MHQTEILPRQVFISYAKEDSATASKLCRELAEEGISAWLDSEQLSPGDNWDLSIRRAIKNCRYILVLLSRRSISKRGYVQKEIRLALDVADSMPDDEIFIMPVRLEQCEVSERLQKWQWCDIFLEEQREKLFQSLRRRLGISRFPLLKEQERELRLTLDQDLIADALLFRKFSLVNRTLRSKTSKGLLYISNGHCFEIRPRNTRFISLFDESFPACEKVESFFFQQLIRPRTEYASSENSVRSILCVGEFPLILKSNTSRCGIDPAYWHYVNVKYPKAEVYILDEESPIFVETEGELRFVVMPVRL